MQDNQRLLTWDEASYFVLSKLGQLEDSVTKTSADIAAIRKDIQITSSDNNKNISLLKETINADHLEASEKLGELKMILSSLKTKDRVLTAIAGAIGGSAIVAATTLVIRRLFP